MASRPHDLPPPPGAPAPYFTSNPQYLGTQVLCMGETGGPAFVLVRELVNHMPL